MTTLRRPIRARAFAALFLSGLLLPLMPPMVTSSFADHGDPHVTLQPNTSGCNGVLPTPGSENTTKRLDPNFPSDFNPGGVVGYIIDYPVDAADVAGRTTFVITDCVFVGDTALAKYEVSFVPNTTSYQLRFSVPIPGDVALGGLFCNYAKTTAAPSTSQASNRKAGPACFTVGGALRIEKRSGSTTGALLPGATFTVICSPTVAQPATIITGLSSPSQTNQNGTVSASGTSATGTIAINGPSGTACTVTETAAPAGYDFDPTTRNVTIPVGTSQTVVVFVNTRQSGNLVINKTTSGGTGTFSFVVDCSDNSFDQTVQITGTGSQTISGIPTGTTCTVTETADPLFTSSPTGAQPVTIVAGNNPVSFTNTRNTGDLVINKTTSGGTGTFSFVVDCSDNAFDQTVQITNTGSQTISGIPTGTTCTVTETADPLFTSSPAGPQGVTIGGGDNTVEFRNDLIPPAAAPLTIVKTTVGGSGTFTFTVSCPAINLEQVVQITNSGSATVPQIFVGTICTVTETLDPNFVVTPSASQTVTVPSGGVTVSFTNTGTALGCTRTQGYYSTHPEAVTGLTLGGTSLTATQVNALLRARVSLTYLYAVDQQLIAALLNQASGATVPADVQTAIDAAHALILQQGGPYGTASPRTTVTYNGITYTASQLNNILTSYNQGMFPGGPPHCDG